MSRPRRFVWKHAGVWEATLRHLSPAGLVSIRSYARDCRGPHVCTSNTHTALSFQGSPFRLVGVFPRVKESGGRARHRILMNDV